MKVIESCISESELWSSFKVFTLKENMRLARPDEEDPKNMSWIDIPPNYCVPPDEQGLLNLFDSNYDQSTLQTPSAITLQKKAIVKVCISTMKCNSLKKFMLKGFTWCAHRGDRNNAYFHRILKSRNHRNRVNAVRNEEGRRFEGDKVGRLQLVSSVLDFIHVYQNDGGILSEHVTYRDTYDARLGMTVKEFVEDNREQWPDGWRSMFLMINQFFAINLNREQKDVLRWKRRDGTLGEFFMMPGPLLFWLVLSKDATALVWARDECPGNVVYWV
nr:DNA helicase [Tanacetum cinerariifolium]